MLVICLNSFIWNDLNGFHFLCFSLFSYSLKNKFICSFFFCYVYFIWNKIFQPFFHNHAWVRCLIITIHTSLDINKALLPWDSLLCLEIRKRVIIWVFKVYLTTIFFLLKSVNFFFGVWSSTVVETIFWGQYLW